MIQRISVMMVVCFSVVLLSATGANANVKIGTVDMQKAIQSTEIGKKARTDLESDFNKKKSELQKEEAAIKKMHEEFQKQSLVMNEKARAQKQAELQERVMRFQETTARSQMEIQQREQQLTGPIVEKLRKIIADIAKKNGYTVILERNEHNVLYSEQGTDLTEEVVTTFNKDNKS